MAIRKGRRKNSEKNNLAKKVKDNIEKGNVTDVTPISEKSSKNKSIKTDGIKPSSEPIIPTPNDDNTGNQNTEQSQSNVSDTDPNDNTANVGNSNQTEHKDKTLNDRTPLDSPVAENTNWASTSTDAPFEDIPDAGDAPDMETAEEQQGEEESDGSKESVFTNPEVKDMPADAKRKAATAMANAFTSSYCRYVPMGAKWVAKPNIEKLERASIKGEIDLSREINLGDKDITCKEYFLAVSEDIDDTIQITKEQENEIRDSAIDVAMEYNIGMTPLQRFATACLMPIIELGFLSVKINSSNNALIASLKEDYASRKSIRQEVDEKVKNAQNTEQYDAGTTPTTETENEK